MGMRRISRTSGGGCARAQHEGQGKGKGTKGFDPLGGMGS